MKNIDELGGLMVELIEAVEEAEAVLDTDDLVREALEGIERVRIEPGEEV